MSREKSKGLSVSILDASGSMMGLFLECADRARELSDLLGGGVELVYREAQYASWREPEECKLRVWPRTSENWKKEEEDVLTGGGSLDLRSGMRDAAAWARGNGKKVDRLIVWTDTGVTAGLDMALGWRRLGAKELWVVLADQRDVVLPSQGETNWFEDCKKAFEERPDFGGVKIKALGLDEALTLIKQERARKEAKGLKKEIAPKARGKKPRRMRV